MSSDSRPSSLSKLFRKKWFRWLLILIVLSVIGYFAYDKGLLFWANLQNQWAKANINFQDFGYRWFILGLIVYLVSAVSTFIRWRILLHALHIRCSYADAIRLGFVGYVGSIFLPGSIMGDVFKAGFIVKENPGNRVGAVSSIVVDRLVGLYSLFLLAAIVGLFNLNKILAQANPQAAELELAYYAICLIAVVGLIAYGLFLVIPFEGKGYGARIARIRFIGPIMNKVLAAFTQYRRYPWAMVQAVLIGMAGHVGFVLSYYFASEALPGPGPTPSWQLHFVIIPFFMVFQAVPLTFGGNFGVGDLVLGVLYTFVGGMELKGILASLLQRLITWIVALIGLIWYIPLHRRYAALNVQQPEAEPLNTGEASSHS
ncbi:MAG: lysylphosphatidylglycerol synthase transmembrane domain-containing protein [Gemmatales bacterium]